MSEEKISFEKEKDSVKEVYDVRENTIDEAWHMTLWRCARGGNKQEIGRGSYSGEDTEITRWQLEQLSVRIDEPWRRPLAVFGTQEFPAPTSEERIHEYFARYLASAEKTDNEEYTYGERIEEQWDEAVDMIVQSEGNTNQCCISISKPEDISLENPPCLRQIHFQCVDKEGEPKKLYMSLYFRSWDLYAGFPENIGGLQLLKEKMIIDLENKGFEIEDGPIIAYSSGAHIYSYCKDQVNSMSVNKISF